MKEKRGPGEHQYKYPFSGLNEHLNLYYSFPLFSRNYFTTGTIIANPRLKFDKVDSAQIANLIFEAFLMEIPFERRDIDFGADIYKGQSLLIDKESRFIAIHDSTYGSLRLSSKLTEKTILEHTLSQALELAENDPNIDINQETIEALKYLITQARQPSTSIEVTQQATNFDQARYVQVIKKDSQGLALAKDNREFVVDDIFFSPTEGLCYRGHYLEINNGDAVVIFPIKAISEIPGQSDMGVYDLAMGMIVDSIPE